MGWLRFDEGQDDWSSEHEGYVELVVRQNEITPYWLPVGAVPELDFGRRVIDSDELVSGVRGVSGWSRLREYRIQVACECGWSSPLLPVPLGASWAPCSLILDERDNDAACDLWGRFHRDRVSDWPKSLTQAWPKAGAAGGC